jgi:hypothetical protein
VIVRRRHLDPQIGVQVIVPQVVPEVVVARVRDEPARAGLGTRSCKHVAMMMILIIIGATDMI